MLTRRINDEGPDGNPCSVKPWDGVITVIARPAPVVVYGTKEHPIMGEKRAVFKSRPR